MSPPTTAATSSELERLLLDLTAADAVKFAPRDQPFKLKSGLLSPVYFDLRVMVAHPDILKRVAEQMWQHRDRSAAVDQICGVPYTALPVASLISVQADLPMLVKRKEAKDYGTKKMVEGKVNHGDNCLIIEDVVTSGSSVLETAATLREMGVAVTDAIVLLDREQGGTQMLAEQGIRLTSVCTVTQLLDVLTKHNKVDEDTVERVKDFVRNNQTFRKASSNAPRPEVMQMSLEERASAAQHPLSAKLLDIITRKKSNLCVSLDVPEADRLLEVATAVAPHACCLKTHADGVSDWQRAGVESKLRELAQKHDLLLFEDRKLADIGATVADQVSLGAGRWSDLVTAHAVAGEGVLAGIKAGLEKAGIDKAKRGVLMVAQMSSSGNLITSDYTKRCVEMAESGHKDGLVAGLISQSRLSQLPGLLHFTPGVKMSASGDCLGQQYVGPEEAVVARGADVVIVGRGITQADDVKAAAAMYQEAAWRALQSRIAANTR